MQEHILYEEKQRNKTGRGSRYRFTVPAAIVILTVLYLSLKPAYLQYVENDHRATCQKARFVILDRYRAALAQQAGTTPERTRQDKPDEAFCQELLSEVILENFGIEWSGEETLSGLCRSGGAYTMRLDEETRLPELYCDCEGHGAYTGVY